MNDPSYIEIGRVVGTHGVAGKIRVAPFSGDPSGLLRVPRIRLKGHAGRGVAGERDFELGTAQRSRGCAVFSLKEISSMEEAGALVGSTVLVRRDDLPPPGEDEYYWTDLVGCEVVDASGSRLGTVSGVEQGPAHDWLAVDRGGSESLLPMVSDFIREVDIAGRRIVVSPPGDW